MRGTTQTRRNAGVEAEEGTNMQTFQRIAITAAFTLTCFTVPVLKASAGETPANAASSGEDVSTIQRPSGTTGEITGKVDVGSLPDWTKGALADQLKALQDQFKKEQKDLIARYQELLKKAKDQSQEERAKVRDLFKTEREALIEAQKELRDQVKATFEEFRNEHSEHKELIDAAKEKAKERIKQRRGQGEGE